MLPETPGFVAAMDTAGPWAPVGIALAMSEPNGPVEHGFFEELLDTIERRLRAALPVDGVYICAHGAAITTEEDDPEGALFEHIREIVGPGVPVVATFDLHANVSDRMVDLIDAFIGYRFPRLHGEISFGVLNLTDQDYHLNPLTVFSELPRERVYVGRLRLSF